ncbi:MAG TPA: CPBP family intramembrane glutamic endopeptidase [Dehalococcoidia bacterium]|nr:CPBP family intramembrane glutamic endopeptidase [Dehalococcoidia bacterium]
MAATSPGPPVDTDDGIRQYSLTEILIVWAAAAVPMGLLAWVGAPLLREVLSGDERLIKALFILLTAGLIWQFILVLILVRREQGSLSWPVLCGVLWLQSPRDPNSGRVGGRLWLWVIPFILALALLQAIPLHLPASDSRDFAEFLDSDDGEEFFSGAWGWFALFVVLAIFNTILGEELLFRGVLLPRMQGVFGQRDWIANAVIFGFYHLHFPWNIPNSIVSGLLYAYPTRRWRSAWMGIIIHSAESVVIGAIILALVLD